MSEQIAIQIWTDWVDRGFFIEAPAGTSDMPGQPVYFFNPGQPEEWRDVMYPPNLPKRIWRWSLKKLLYPLIVASIASLITVLLANTFSNDPVKNRLDQYEKTLNSVSSSLDSLKADILGTSARIDSLQIQLEQNRSKADSIEAYLQNLMKPES